MARAAKGTGKISLAPRAKKAKKARNPLFLDEKYTGPEPVWDGWDKWSAERFRKEKTRGFYYYNYFNTAKELIPNVIKWMDQNGYTKEEIRAYKEVPDWQTTITIGSLTTMMLKGMPSKHPEINDGDSVDWIKQKINPLIEQGKKILKEKKAEEKNSVNAYVPTIQDRVRESAFVFVEAFEEWLDKFIDSPSDFDPKEINPLSFLKGKEANQAHARIIKDYFTRQKEDYDELLNPPSVKDDNYAQLVEGYRRYNKVQLKNMHFALTEIVSACNMLLQQAKVNRKPRVKKAPSKEKLVSKIKFKVSDDRYKLVSIKPEEALQSLELWVFNTKTRKFGVYVASDQAALSVKGTSIINFDEGKSIAKTVRKPEEFFRDIKSTPKTKMRKLYDAINSVETKLNGRLNDDVILIKAFT